MTARNKKAEKFLWKEKIERDFIQLKKAITKGRIQAFPDFGVGDLFVLITDWSKENIANEGVLSQVQDGKEWFLGCCGRNFNKYELNYPSYKGKLYSCDPVFQEMEAYLRYQPFEVHIDASALKYLTTIKNQSGLFTRWY